MKKFVFILFSLLILSLPALAKDGVTVVVDGSVLECDVAGEIIENRTYVPLRAIAEALGASVEWDGETGGITLNTDGRETSLSIGSLSATITEGSKVSAETLEAAPYIKQERTMVPLRFVARALGRRTAWCADLNAAVITQKSSAVSGGMRTLTEKLFTELIPDASRYDGEDIAEDIQKNPESVMNYIKNLWTREAIELLSEQLSDAELSEYEALAGSDDKQYAFLAETAQAHDVPLECPIKMCALHNGKTYAVLIDCPGMNIGTMSPLCVLKSVDGKVVSENL